MLKFNKFLEEVKKPTGKLKDACWKGYTAVGTKEKNGRTVPNCVPVKEETDKVDTITVDIPLMIRLLEYAREDAKTDMDLHKVTERLIEIRSKGMLTMADYEFVATGKHNVKEEHLDEKSAAWQRKEGKKESGGLNQRGVDSYRREHPGSKLKTAVTTEPSKLDPDSKSAKRRKSFCSRMKGMKSKLTSAKTAKDPDSRINKSLRKWNCN
jgi:hypothetical protein